jgi:NAD(P)-dependent dehydrogenase (short-subunit alcohol dehydrogenase family)
VITGSGSGLGAEAARLFASEGAAVVVSDLAEEAGRKVVSEIRAAGGRAEFIRTDVRETASVEALYAGAREAFGLVNVLYNNAGISPADDDGVVETSDGTWSWTSTSRGSPAAAGPASPTCARPVVARLSTWRASSPPWAPPPRRSPIPPPRAPSSP